MEQLIEGAETLEALNALVQHFNFWKGSPALVQRIFTRFCLFAREQPEAQLGFGNDDFWAAVLGGDET